MQNIPIGYPGFQPSSKASIKALSPEGAVAGKTQEGAIIFVGWEDGGCLDGVKKREATKRLKVLGFLGKTQLFVVSQPIESM